MKEVRPIAELIAETQDEMVAREETEIKCKLRGILSNIACAQDDIKYHQKRLADCQKQLAEFKA